ncbi:phosphate signaling complex protein PhoU [Deinococcus radiodurans]|jgi:phosphate uptake regulator, PhoU|uniref:Phosphate-specific transport system accessory protein PhoU homolog n=1 Tax=Deinococcus radiodurans (strain ATCC 13939 / DSM 20539 / JCM 16871 / CCUG 27074 / LMG 4051 / NBRC 15346 / NCIMB 9279 / VKM B-1422 / R1) TaxID=243230 RepID=PHOU_DEIRA|nr:phosphate signaling complex protein PhoU [Deinococcus radiodurans]Q9RS84.1 RecName: Full=Phosphate-specific transport system accessory protein PhoU homolog; Short=Pst system accessory protein PhoU homolog [Deinococcus radiodurans R1 = ATCC 13939 = DSM 20539]AAF11788.1 phosphate transport system regulatory protein PhoU [Deinococcus radiodurans R1 = ATCC 13939 = DSM 20539]ANC70698.1 phosphate transport system regulatory protein PhoU [Deinococcus radiodurans R1 = ATCC 13939 = DSM 20539]QEM71627
MREALEADLRAVLNGALNMLGTVERMLPVAAEVLLHERADLLGEVRSLDREVDAQEAQLEAECLRIIALHQPVARDLRLVALILKSLSDIERMGDYVVHVAEDGAELAQAPALKKYVNLSRMLSRLTEMSQNLRTSLADRDVTRAENTTRMDDEVDELYEQIQRELVTYMLEDPRNISKALMLMRVGRSLERVGDHMENVAERVRYWVTGSRE